MDETLADFKRKHEALRTKDIQTMERLDTRIISIVTMTADTLMKVWRDS